MYTVTGTLCVYLGSHSVPQHKETDVKSRQLQCASHLNCSALTHCQYMAPFCETGTKMYEKICDYR
jgi:hypothetical protein